MLAAAEGGGNDLVILNPAPWADSLAVAAAQVAGLVLISCRASAMDLETAAITAQLVRFAGDREAVTRFFDPRVRRQFKIMEAERDSTVQALLTEAPNDVFAKHGKPELAE